MLKTILASFGKTGLHDRLRQKRDGNDSQAGFDREKISGGDCVVHRKNTEMMASKIAGRKSAKQRRKQLNFVQS